MEASGGLSSWISRKPFAVWVIAGGLFYAGLALLALSLPFALVGGDLANPFLLILFVFIAIFLVAGVFSLQQKRWAYILGAVMSIVLVLLFSTNIASSLSNPADSGFWLSISVLPILFLVVLFSVLTFRNAKTGVAQKRYLASPQSTGGLLTVAIVGFVIGALVAGAIGAGVILTNISGGAADVSIVSGAASMGGNAYSPHSFAVTLASGGKVTWINKDTTSHTVTSNQTGLFDSGSLGVGATWSHTFTTAGTYYYYCSIHPMMWGVVVVA